MRVYENKSLYIWTKKHGFNRTKHKNGILKTYFQINWKKSCRFVKDNVRLIV